MPRSIIRLTNLSSIFSKSRLYPVLHKFLITFRKLRKPSFNEVNTIEIPEIKRDGKLLNRLFPVILGGFDQVMDKESQLYLRLLARLVDKAYSEYSIARAYLLEEIKENDKLAYRIEIINHFENCISAINRASKIMYILANGWSHKNNDGTKTIIKKDLDIYKLVRKDTREKIAAKSVSVVRNRVEHIDEDVYLNKFTDKLFLDVTDNYKNISINGKSLPLVDLANMITTYYELALEIFDGLPKKWADGEYHYE